MPTPSTQPALARHCRRSASARRQVRLLEAIADLTRARDAAEAAHRAKSAFVAGLSHRLRTPLNTILLCGELLHEDLEAQGLEALARDADQIRDAGHLLLSMLDDVLDLTRLEAGRMVFRQVDVDLAALAGELEAACQPMARSNGNTLAVRAEAMAMASLATDPDKLGQVLLHLLRNAMKFTRGGAVTLDLRAEDQVVVFTVSDTGIGMSQEQVERIRQDFALTRASQPPSYGNAGLGLTLCRVLAQGLGGHLQVESPAGGGSIFTLRLSRPSAP